MSVLSYYHKVKNIIENQSSMVSEYKSAWAVFRQDKNFTAEELDYMADVYSVSSIMVSVRHCNHYSKNR